MKQEEILRQEAIRLHLQGESVRAIAAKIDRSRHRTFTFIIKYTACVFAF
jgi:transposase